MAIAAASSSSLSSSSAAAAAVLLLLLLAMAMATEGATAVSVDCNNVNRYFVPCLGFLVSSGSSPPSPSPQCCANVRSLNAQSKGPVRAAVCQCIKRNAQNIPGLNQQRASSLPTLCRIPLGLKITPTTDCSR
jgi:hypothetical protein